jgi:hypothetical protein
VQQGKYDIKSADAGFRSVKSDEVTLAGTQLHGHAPIVRDLNLVQQCWLTIIEKPLSRPGDTYQDHLVT